MAKRARKGLKQPKYLDVAEGILSEIRSGRLNAGDKLPSERELREKYDADPFGTKKANVHLSVLIFSCMARMVASTPGSFELFSCPSVTTLTMNVVSGFPSSSSSNF